MLSGLPYNDVSFASLPPHFDSVGAPQVGWATVFPLYSTLPGTVKRALPFLLASICHHEVWLRESLSPQHPLFSSPLFTSGTLAELRPHIRAGCYRSTATGLTATGIPPHLAMSNELTTVARETAAMKAQLLSQYAALPADLTSHLLAKFTIQGAVPVTLDDLKAVMAQAVSEMHAHVRDALPDAARAATAPAAADPNSDDARFNVWAWGGAMHMVPEGWRMSSTDLMSTWRLWHFGNAAEHIRPLRHLKKRDLADTAQITQWSKTNGVMNAVTEQMVSMGAVESAVAIARLTEEAATLAFTQAMPRLMEEMKPGSTQRRGRWTEMSITTLYDHLQTSKKQRKRRREELEAAGVAASESEGAAQTVQLQL